MPNCETRTDRLAEANDLRGVIDLADFDDADKLGEGKRWWAAQRAARLAQTRIMI